MGHFWSWVLGAVLDWAKLNVYCTFALYLCYCNTWYTEYVTAVDALVGYKNKFFQWE